MHTSAHKEAEFIHTELAKQVQAVHVTVFPFEVVNFLKKLWLLPVAVITQVGRRPQLIYDFTWRRLNKTSKFLSPMEVMRFRGALQRILKQVLAADPRLGPVYLSKVDLADAYMRFWVRMEDVQSVAFLILKKNTSNIQLVVFHILLPIGYIDSAPYFCMATDTVTDLANKTIALRERADEHPLELEYEARAVDDANASPTKADTSWASLPVEQRSAATENVNIYLDNFISVVQGGTRERCQMLRHLFYQIDQVFFPKEEAETNSRDPISLKKLGQGDGSWFTQKTVLGWDLDTIAYLICLPPTRREKVVAALGAIPR